MKKSVKGFTVYFVTENLHKYNEIHALIKQNNLKVDCKHSSLKTIEIQAESNNEIALYKLQSVKDKINASFFIEDAGLYVDYPLNGFPGVYSSYVYKTIGNQGILRLIDDFDQSKAHFSAIIAFYFKPLDKTYLFEGTVNGKISSEIKGGHGFGFDPIFISHEIPHKTFGELTLEEKNRISHRAKALNQLIALLRELQINFR